MLVAGSLGSACYNLCLELASAGTTRYCSNDGPGGGAHAREHDGRVWLGSSATG